MKSNRPQHTHVKKRRRRRGLLVGGSLLIAAALITGVTMAKYVRKWHTAPTQADAKSFYFTSDLLKEPSENARYYIDPLTASFKISLSNSGSSQKVTSEDIAFAIQAEGALTDTTAGILTGGSTGSAAIKVTPNGTGNPITISASASSPYQKTLTATFHLALGNTYSVEDKAGNTAAALTMTCADAAKDIRLFLPTGVIPDATDGRVSASDSGGYLFHSPGQGVYSLTLLKANTGLNLQINDAAFADRIDIMGS